MKRKSLSIINIWPGFVDVIATLLLVFVFLLAVLMISENFLTQAISGKNTALENLRSNRTASGAQNTPRCPSPCGLHASPHALAGGSTNPNKLA